MAFDQKNFAYFAIINRDLSGSVGFSSWQDSQGNHYRAINGYGPTGTPRPFNINFSPSELIYRAGKKQKVTVLLNNQPKEMLLVDYLKDSSLCEGSPNLRGPAVFKMIDEEKDAGVLIDAKRLRREASNAAFDLESKPKELAEIAQLIGEFRDNKDIQFAAVINFADADPRTFLNYINSPDRQARALVKKGLSTGELTLKGKIITWKNETLGADEDEAVQRLTREPEVMKALAVAVKKNK